MSKPTRKARRYIKEAKGKGERPGKGEGKRRFAFLAEMPEVEYDDAFFGGRGKNKGKRRSFGKGKGRRGNPYGADGQQMTCSICGSTEYFRAQCSEGHTSHGLAVSALTVSASLPSEGPLGDLLAPQRQAMIAAVVLPNLPNGTPLAYAKRYRRKAFGHSIQRFQNRWRHTTLYTWTVN